MILCQCWHLTVSLIFKYNFIIRATISIYLAHIVCRCNRTRSTKKKQLFHCRFPWGEWRTIDSINDKMDKLRIYVSRQHNRTKHKHHDASTSCVVSSQKAQYSVKAQSFKIEFSNSLSLSLSFMRKFEICDTLKIGGK